MTDNKFMKAAINEAKKAYKKEEVPVGAVIIKEGVIIAKAHNLRESKNLATAHAEIICIEKACKKLKSWRLDGCDLYVTLEPCAMCCGAISQARINKVYFGAKDLKNGCIGSVCNILEQNITWKTNYEYIEDKDCSNILTQFFKEIRKKRKN